ncbi:CGL21 [Auxenochlorella protothecoides x Auxenochlorella symbiontica]|uniref:Armadillo-like repeats domain-containing protein n=1 Tax=Auxenochlorella protothecoides TaxID=3075 RepID=A0A1D1ZVP5_AUXPR
MAACQGIGVSQHRSLIGTYGRFPGDPFVRRSGGSAWRMRPRLSPVRAHPGTPPVDDGELVTPDPAPEVLPLELGDAELREATGLQDGLAGSDFPAQDAADERAEEAAAAAAQDVDAAATRHWVSLPSLPASLAERPALRYAALGLGGFLALNVVLVGVKALRKALSPQQRRHRTVNKNQLVVTTLAQYLPSNRAGLAGSILGSLRFRTGFNNVEIFRKYLWYLLRERAFKQEAVDDLLALKAALQLTDSEVAAALRERAQRIYDKYGNVMLDTSGMTGAGIERKATSRALFSKLQYLTQVEGLLSPEAAKEVDLRKIFGATEDDVARLRIVSLQDVDLEALMEQSSAVEPKKEEPGAQL